MNAIYARQSVDRTDSVSIESQIEHCMYEVKKEECRIYTDKGYSGKNTDRPEFRLMVEHIKQGHIKKVVVYKLDRISRSVLDFSNTMEIFKTYGVEFVSVNEKFDTSTPMGRAMLNICIVFAELERETIQQRVADAYVSRSRMGFYMGGRIPYGFKLEPVVINGVHTSRYIPVEDEIAHLKFIYEMYSKPAASLSDVVKYFKENGIEKARGVKWSTSRISEMLKNPIYVKADIDVYNFYSSRGTEVVNTTDSFIGENGCYLYTKNVQAAGKKKDMAQYGNMVLVMASHKGVVESEKWIKCRLKAEQNMQIPRGRKQVKTWLSGKLKCGKCGYALRYNKWAGKTTVNEYFLCSEVCGNRRCEGFGSVKKDYVEKEILRQIEKKVAEIKIEQNRPSKNQLEINSINIAIASKEKEIDEMLERFAGGNEAIMRRINEKADNIEADILALKNELFKLELSKNCRTHLDNGIIADIFKKWDKVPFTEKHCVADILIKKVLVTDKIIEIVWKI